MAESAEETWANILIGQKVGAFTICAYRGGGAFGLVFEATDSKGSEVAIKVLPPGPGLSQEVILEFLREGALLGELRKASNVVDLVEVGNHELVLTTELGLKVPLGLHYMALEIAAGSLQDLILAAESISLQEKFSLWRGAVLGVHQMHLRSVVHRDIKSDNCLLFILPKKRTVCKMADLGRARDFTQPPMIPPEQYLAGRGDLRFAPPEFLWLQGVDSPESHKLADLYGLGSLLFEVIVGQGITGLTLGPGPEVVRQSFMDGHAGKSVGLSFLQGAYAPAFEIFSSYLPSGIRKQATDLVSQLCHPVPERRLPVQRGAKGRQQQEPGLNWLLRKVDILTKIIAMDEQKVPHLTDR
ncbi:protein kinase [Streptomyces sp. NPDC086838]|uniref:protein kinase domain-containing protein n=1 Tax=Streptomyces sp. NPDC086838 TaxID=3365762 RepID=UPI00381C2B88